MAAGRGPANPAPVRPVIAGAAVRVDPVLPATAAGRLAAALSAAGRREFPGAAVMAALVPDPAVSPAARRAMAVEPVGRA